MKQLTLELEVLVASAHPPPVALAPPIQAEVVARLAEAIIAVQQSEQDPTHEATPQPS